MAVQQYIANKWCPAMLGETPEKRATVQMLHCIAIETFIKAIGEIF
jgi:hypothetical protein